MDKDSAGYPRTEDNDPDAQEFWASESGVEEVTTEYLNEKLDKIIIEMLLEDQSKKSRK